MLWVRGQQELQASSKDLAEQALLLEQRRSDVSNKLKAKEAEREQLEAKLEECLCEVGCKDAFRLCASAECRHGAQVLGAEAVVGCAGEGDTAFCLADKALCSDRCSAEVRGFGARGRRAAPPPPSQKPGRGSETARTALQKRGSLERHQGKPLLCRERS